MNKRFLLAACLVMMAVVGAKAQMKFNVYYEQVINERGELADFALECLGQDNAILQSDTVYKLDKIVQAVKKPAAQQPAQGVDAPKQASAQPKHNSNVHSSVPKHAPLSEEAAHALSPAKKAEAVAKQIFSIRETRNDILRGEVEHMPADGQSMSLVLGELNKQEKALMELFLGRKTVIRKKEVISVVVSADELEIEKAIARFSEQDGFAAINNTEAEPIMIHVQRYTQRVLAAEQPKKKKAEPIYENKIVRSNIQVLYDGKVMFERVITEK